MKIVDINGLRYCITGQGKTNRKVVLLVIIIWRKELFKSELFRLVIMEFLFGLAITWTFTETGPRANHGNFGWGNILGSSMLWIVCTVFYWDRLMKDGKTGLKQIMKAKYAVPAVFLLWHVAAGISYYSRLLTDLNSQR